MTIEQNDRTVVTETPSVGTDQATVAPVTSQQTVRTDSHRMTSSGPGASELTRRIIVLLFGLVQIVIGARIVLLLLAAREANGIVSGILNVSSIFVAPFEGILRTDALHKAGSTLDIAAIVALVGWTIIELIVIWAVGIFRREPANT
jgi:YGGT family